MKNMRIDVLVIFVFSAIFFLGCESGTKHASPQPSKGSEFKFAGDWEYSFPFYYSSLILEGTGKFRFYERGCFGEWYSEGLWTSDSVSVTLNSFDEMRKTTCYAQEEIAESIDSVYITAVEDSVAQNSEELSITYKPAAWDFEKLNLAYKTPPPSDTTYVYFDSQRFIFRQDTLYEVDKNFVLTGTKFGKRRIMMGARL